MFNCTLYAFLLRYTNAVSGSHDGTIMRILRSRAGNVTYWRRPLRRGHLPKIRLRHQIQINHDTVARKALQCFKERGASLDPI